MIIFYSFWKVLFAAAMFVETDAIVFLDFADRMGDITSGND